MRVLFTADWHLDGGGRLGDPDHEYGSTRLRDAMKVLDRISAEPCDVLILGGDVAQGPSPRPNVARLVHDCLAASRARHIVATIGNHDSPGAEKFSIIDVCCQGLAHATVSRVPEVIQLPGLQVATLPWTPPQRMYGGRADRGEANAIVAEVLVEVAQGLAARLKPGIPSVLIVHWLLAGSAIGASGMDIMKVNEPILPVADLEAAGPWTILAGHNHRRQAVGERSWVCGPPLRHSFGEAALDVGFLLVDIESDSVVVTPVDVDDRPLITVNVDVPAFLDGGALALPDLDGAIVRLRGECTEHEAQRLAADGAQVSGELLDACYLAGASKVLGPELDVQREARTRSDLTVETEPVAALQEWLSRQDVDRDTASAAVNEAHRIVAGESNLTESGVGDDVEMEMLFPGARP